MAETSQSAMRPYVAMAAVGSALYAWTAVFRAALVAKVPGGDGDGGGGGAGGGGVGGGGEGGGDGGGGDGGGDGCVAAAPSNWQKTHISARSRTTPWADEGSGDSGFVLGHVVDSGWGLPSSHRRLANRQYAKRGGWGNATNGGPGSCVVGLAWRGWLHSPGGRAHAQGTATVWERRCTRRVTAQGRSEFRQESPYV